MSVPSSQNHNISKYSPTYSNKGYSKKKNYKKYKFYKHKSQNPIKSHKREIGCFKYGQKEHIAPNCKKQKINILSDSEEDYYSEESTTSLSESDNSQNKNPILEKEHNQTDKIENFYVKLMF